MNKMGTNFYWLTRPKSLKIKKIATGEIIYPCININEPEYGLHLGKRSAAGYYCWDCKLTLCAGGEINVHKSLENWYTECPKCGKSKDKIKGFKNTASVEFGFCKPNDLKRIGVHTCCSFTWAENPDEIKNFCKKNLDKNIVVNEYGEEFTGKQFLEEELIICPIEFTHLIGEEFS